MQENSTKTKVSTGKKIKFILFTLVFLLIIVSVIGEIVLAIKGYPSAYKKMQRVSLTQAKWWICDSVEGPRYVARQTTKEDSIYFLREIWYYHRLNMINNAGYHDKDDFTDISPASDSIKVLMTGDSFTWGASSDIGSSYVDIFESDLKKAHPALVWNTGMPATGTNHALFTAKKFLPVQKSNYVVLGFYVGNDFGDNLLPFDRLMFNNKASCYNLYDYDRNFKPVQISLNEAYKKAMGSYPVSELNFIQKLLIRSRFYTFISELKDKVVNRLSGNKGRTVEEEYKTTKAYLKQLDDYVKANNAELIVVIIPSRDDVQKKEVHYTNALKLMNELAIPYIDPLSQFTDDDYLKIDGGHWKNRAHILTGHMLSKYLLDHIEKKQQKTFKKK